MIISSINIIVSHSYPASCGMSQGQWGLICCLTSIWGDCIKIICFYVISFPTLTCEFLKAGTTLSASPLPFRIGLGQDWELRHTCWTELHVPLPLPPPPSIPLKEVRCTENTAKRDLRETERRHLCRGLIHPVFRKVCFIMTVGIY